MKARLAMQVFLCTENILNSVNAGQIPKAIEDRSGEDVSLRIGLLPLADALKAQLVLARPVVFLELGGNCAASKRCQQCGILAMVPDAS